MRLKSIEELPARHRETARAQLAGLPPLRAVDLPAPSPALPRPTKYGNSPIKVGEERFDSKLEWRCAEWLKSRIAAGEVLWFIRQVPFRLEGGVRYRADYLAALSAGPPFIEVIDAKGVLTESSRNKLLQVQERYGIQVRLWPKDYA